MEKELLLFLQQQIGQNYERKKKLIIIAETAYALMGEEARDKFDEDLGAAPRVALMRMREQVRLVKTAHEVFTQAVKELRAGE